MGKFTRLVDRLGPQVDQLDPGRLVPVWRVPGGATRLDTYLRTRVVELGVHADDLAVNTGAPLELRPAVVDVTLDVFLEMARARSGDVAVLRAFARCERSDPDVLRAF